MLDKINEKELFEKLLNLFETLNETLMSNSAGFEICKIIDLNEGINLLDYEHKLLIYTVNYNPSKLLGSKINDNKINVRGLFDFLKKEGLKYGRNPIPVYNKDSYKNKVNVKYAWVLNNLKFLIDIFKIRIERFEARRPQKLRKNMKIESDGNEIIGSLADYQKYLDEEGVKINMEEKGYELIICPLCYMKIQKESVICSFCGSNIRNINE